MSDFSGGRFNFIVNLANEGLRATREASVRDINFEREQEVRATEAARQDKVRAEGRQQTLEDIATQRRFQMTDEITGYLSTLEPNDPLMAQGQTLLRGIQATGKLPGEKALQALENLQVKSQQSVAVPPGSWMPGVAERNGVPVQGPPSQKQSTVAESGTDVLARLRQGSRLAERGRTLTDEERNHNFALNLMGEQFNLQSLDREDQQEFQALRSDLEMAAVQGRFDTTTANELVQFAARQGQEMTLAQIQAGLQREGYALQRETTAAMIERDKFIQDKGLNHDRYEARYDALQNRAIELSVAKGTPEGQAAIDAEIALTKTRMENEQISQIDGEALIQTLTHGSPVAAAQHEGQLLTNRNTKIAGDAALQNMDWTGVKIDREYAGLAGDAITNETLAFNLDEAKAMQSVSRALMTGELDLQTANIMIAEAGGDMAKLQILLTENDVAQIPVRNAIEAQDAADRHLGSQASTRATTAGAVASETLLPGQVLEQDANLRNVDSTITARDTMLPYEVRNLDTGTQALLEGIRTSEQQRLIAERTEGRNTRSDSDINIQSALVSGDDSMLTDDEKAGLAQRMGVDDQGREIAPGSETYQQTLRGRAHAAITTLYAADALAENQAALSELNLTIGEQSIDLNAQAIETNDWQQRVNLYEQGQNVRGDEVTKLTEAMDLGLTKVFDAILTDPAELGYLDELGIKREQVEKMREASVIKGNINGGAMRLAEMEVNRQLRAMASGETVDEISLLGALGEGYSADQFQNFLDTNPIARTLDQADRDAVFSAISRREKGRAFTDGSYERYMSQAEVIINSSAATGTLDDTSREALNTLFTEAGVDPVVQEAILGQAGLMATSTADARTREALLSTMEVALHFAEGQGKLYGVNATLPVEQRVTASLQTLQYNNPKLAVDPVAGTVNGDTYYNIADIDKTGITIDSFMESLGIQESGGRTTDENGKIVTGVDTGGGQGTAKGKYQMLDSNWTAWLAEAGLPASTPRTEANEDMVARKKIERLYNQYGSWEDVALSWYGRGKDQNGNIASRYGSMPASQEFQNTFNGVPGKTRNAYVGDVLMRAGGKYPEAVVSGEFDSELQNTLRNGYQLLMDAVNKNAEQAGCMRENVLQDAAAECSTFVDERLRIANSFMTIAETNGLPTMPYDPNALSTDTQQTVKALIEGGSTPEDILENSAPEERMNVANILSGMGMTPAVRVQSDGSLVQDPPAVVDGKPNRAWEMENTMQPEFQSFAQEYQGASDWGRRIFGKLGAGMGGRTKSDIINDVAKQYGISKQEAKRLLDQGKVGGAAAPVDSTSAGMAGFNMRG